MPLVPHLTTLTCHTRRELKPQDMWQGSISRGAFLCHRKYWSFAKHNKKKRVSSSFRQKSGSITMPNNVIRKHWYRTWSSCGPRETWFKATRKTTMDRSMYTLVSVSPQCWWFANNQAKVSLALVSAKSCSFTLTNMIICSHWYRTWLGCVPLDTWIQATRYVTMDMSIYREREREKMTP